MLSVDLRNAIESPEINNFTCLLFRLILKADPQNVEKLSEVYPLEVLMVVLYKEHFDSLKTFDNIEKVARNTL